MFKHGYGLDLGGWKWSGFVHLYPVSLNLDFTSVSAYLSLTTLPGVKITMSNVEVHNKIGRL